MEKKCSLCGSTMVKKGTTNVKKEIYTIFFCEKCHHEVAGSND